MVTTNNKLKRLSFLLALLCICSCCAISQPVTAKAAAPDEIMPLYTTVNSANCSIVISGIKATCSASLTSQKSASLKIKMEIQKKKSGVYSTVKTWTKSKTGNAISDSQTRNINILYDYRLKATLTAGSETIVIYAYPS